MSTNNLYNQDANKKIKELAEDIDFAMMATNTGKKPFHAIPMSTKKVDDMGCIWFLSNKDSEHNQHIENDKQIQLLYSKPSDMSFMVLTGNAYINTNKMTLNSLYGSMDDQWFEGVDDPNLTAIEFKPTSAHYWEPKHNKLVTLFKMGVSSMTGDEPDISNEGEMKP